MEQHHIAAGLKWLAISYCCGAFFLIAHSIIRPLSEHLFAKANAAIVETSRGIANRDVALAPSTGDETDRLLAQLQWIRIAAFLNLAMLLAVAGGIARATWLLAGTVNRTWSIPARAASLAMPLLVINLLINAADPMTTLLGQLVAAFTTLTHERAVTGVARSAGEISLREALRGRYTLQYCLVFVGITAGLGMGAFGAAPWLVMLTISTSKIVGAVLMIDLARLIRRLAAAL